MSLIDIDIRYFSSISASSWSSGRRRRTGRRPRGARTRMA